MFLADKSGNKQDNLDFDDANMNEEDYINIVRSGETPSMDIIANNPQPVAQPPTGQPIEEKNDSGFNLNLGFNEEDYSGGFSQEPIEIEDEEVDLEDEPTLPTGQKKVYVDIFNEEEEGD